MKTIQLIQGSKEWHEHRAKHFNASDAPAMLGCSPYLTRTELLQGLRKDVDPATQERFDKGHRFEALARPLAEEIIGEELSPTTGSRGKISASFDGVTMLRDIAFEHKTLNKELKSIMVEGCTGRDLPKHYQVQMEQQCYVSGCEKVLFMASAWDDYDNLIEKRECWYTPNRDLREEVIKGWDQFEVDLASYQQKEAVAEAVADPQEALPAVVVEVSGSLAITDNLDVFGKALSSFVDNLNLAPKTDQDFANLEAATKALKKAEDALTTEEDRALAQADGIEALRRTVAQYRELARTTRLRAEKVVKAEKENRRNEIRAEAVDAFRAHVEQINAALGGRVRLPEITIDVAAAMKGKKTLSSLEDAAATEVARAKIEANRVADHYRKNLATLDAERKGYGFLFHDMADLVTLNPEHLLGVIQGRIAAHKEAEQLKLEAERERIREEEQAKAKAEAAKQAEPVPEKPIHQTTDLYGPHGSNAHPAAAAELAPASRPQLTNTRPSDRQIIGTLMHAYGADRATVIAWLAEMDLEEAA